MEAAAGNPERIQKMGLGMPKLDSQADMTSVKTGEGQHETLLQVQVYQQQKEN